jgi:hypothetical protein
MRFGANFNTTFKSQMLRFRGVASLFSRYLNSVCCGRISSSTRCHALVSGLELVSEQALYDYFG